MSAINEAAEKIIKETEKIGKLHSNEAINKIGKQAGEFVFGTADDGMRGLLNHLSGENTFKESVKKAYFNGGDVAVKNANIKALAGTYVGFAAGGRLLSGGGLYRDKTGRSNLPVVPFL